MFMNSQTWVNISCWGHIKLVKSLARAGGDSCACESGILRTGTAGTNTDGGTLGEA